jgi:hypothetical protein
MVLVMEVNGSILIPHIMPPVAYDRGRTAERSRNATYVQTGEHLFAEMVLIFLPDQISF